MKKLIFGLLSVALLFAFVSCNGGKTATEAEKKTAEGISESILSQMDFSFTDREKKSDFEEEDATVITFSENEVKISGDGARSEGDVLVIEKEKIYLLSGTGKGQITVRCGENEKPQLVLNGLSLENPKGPALFSESCDKLFLTVAAGTENTLSDGENYAVSADDLSDGAIFSKTDLCLNGTGKLAVKGAYKHGIVSKDDLTVYGTELSVTAKNVALSGKDCVKIGSAELVLEAGTDAIRSDNSEDSTRGYVYIESGNLSLDAGTDGIQAETVLRIDGGAFSLKTGGGSENASYDSSGFREGWGNWGGGRGFPQEKSAAQSDSSSAKGLKAGVGIQVFGGTFSIDSSDDAVHTNGVLEIFDGTFSVTSGDDGFHADTALTVSGGVISVEKCYEGLESAALSVRGGDISVVSRDDGFNAAGGADSSALGDRPGRGGFSNSTCTVEISGGTVFINAAGDGIDSNGSILISGGKTVILGPEDNGDAAFDYETAGTVTGGTLVALGSSGMQEMPESTEQCTALLTFSSSSGGNVVLTDENGQEIFSVKTEKKFDCALVSSPLMQVGKEYTLSCNGKTLVTFEQTTTAFGNSSSRGGFGGGMDPRGGGGMEPGQNRGGMDRGQNRGGGMDPGGTPPDNGDFPGAKPGEAT